MNDIVGWSSALTQSAIELANLGEFLGCMGRSGIFAAPSCSFLGVVSNQGLGVVGLVVIVHLLALVSALFLVFIPLQVACAHQVFDCIA